MAPKRVSSAATQSGRTLVDIRPMSTQVRIIVSGKPVNDCCTNADCTVSLGCSCAPHPKPRLNSIVLRDRSQMNSLAFLLFLFSSLPALFSSSAQRPVFL